MGLNLYWHDKPFGLRHRIEICASRIAHRQQDIPAMPRKLPRHVIDSGIAD
jgi:hypothetical protein